MPNSIMVENTPLSPGKIVCVGQNYLEHIKELGNTVPKEVVIFCKPNSAIGTRLHAFQGEAIHYEAELCLVVKGNRFTHAGIGLDLTKRGLQKTLRQAGLPWERAKAFDGAALFSDFVPLSGGLDELEFSLHIDEKCQQRGQAQDMLFSPEKILNAICGFMSLQDGDVVMTGTPSGVGEVKAKSTYTGRLTQNAATLVSKSWLAH